MEMIGIVSIIAIITLGIYRLFELFARRKERMAVIEKLSVGIDPEVLRNQFKMPVYKELTSGSWAIRVGLLLIGVGLGVVIAAIVDLLAVPPVETNDRVFYEFRNTISVLYPACAAVFGGIGLVIAYFVEKKNEKTSEKE
ncbi:DUF6249 domain-containing protein [Prevotella sp. 10(H)]|uniref:DUF6249 domain-containing protein n=1 Tax=Prevotella sp. 10(H) TaxID=1158294 RepID=UPI0004A6E72B|nr:DUF6249 domain-containing protein [Prevotella sp. 10(H)]